jgi:hypothetical protein
VNRAGGAAKQPGFGGSPRPADSGTCIWLAAHHRRRTRAVAKAGSAITSTPSGKISSRHCRCVSAMLASISTGTRGSAPEALAAI